MSERNQVRYNSWAICGDFQCFNEVNTSVYVYGYEYIFELLGVRRNSADYDNNV